MEVWRIQDSKQHPSGMPVSEVAGLPAGATALACFVLLKMGIIITHLSKGSEDSELLSIGSAVTA